MKFIINLLLFIVDFNHKRKILYFFKKIFQNRSLVIIDVGAHHGETIKLFFKNFIIKKMLCYEASKSNYFKLKKIINNFPYKKSKIKFYNIGIGEKKQIKKFNQTTESSSSTFAKINFKSKYFKKKNNILKIFFGNKYILRSYNVKLENLDNEIIKHKLKEIDIIKIDTEGFEYQIIKGLKKKIHLVKYIYFEHHFDQMLVKNYTYKEINHLLKMANFKKVFKIKMPFRKTFEYIYANNKN